MLAPKKQQLLTLARPKRSHRRRTLPHSSPSSALPPEPGHLFSEACPPISPIFVFYLCIILLPFRCLRATCVCWCGRPSAL